MKIFANHRTSCRISGSDFEYEAFFIFSFSHLPEWNSAFSTQYLTPTSNLLRLLSILAYQVVLNHPQSSNTHTLWGSFCISWKIKQSSFPLLNNVSLSQNSLVTKWKFAAWKWKWSSLVPIQLELPSVLHLSGWVLLCSSPVFRM